MIKMQQRYMLQKVEEQRYMLQKVEEQRYMLQKVEEQRYMLQKVEEQRYMLQKVEEQRYMLQKVEEQLYMLQKVEEQRYMLQKVEEQRYMLQKVEEQRYMLQKVEEQRYMLQKVEEQRYMLQKVEEQRYMLQKVEEQRYMLQKVEEQRYMLQKVEEQRYMLQKVEEQRYMLQKVEEQRYMLQKVEEQRYMLQKVEEQQYMLQKVEEQRYMLQKVEEQRYMLQKVKEAEDLISDVLFYPHNNSNVDLSTIYVANGDSDQGLGCEPGYWYYNNYCFFFENVRRVTWKQANDECTLKNGIRTRFESQDELNWFVSIAQNITSDGYWTDLNDLPPDGSSLQGNGHWRYGTDEFPIANLIVWNVSPQNDGVSNCAGINILGNLEDTFCNSSQSYICQAPMIDGGCIGKGWLNSDTKCYWIANVTQPQDMITWQQARKRCSTLAMAAGFPSGDLISIDSASDQTFLSGEVPYLTLSSKLHWIGFQYVRKQWQWTSMNPVNTNLFTWATEPDNVGGLESCAMVRMNGKFSDQNCNSLHNFVCKKAQDYSSDYMNLGCGMWNRAGKKCYEFYQSPVSTWADSRKRCQSIGGDLLKVTSKDEMYWVTNQMMMYRRKFWTGLNDINVEGNYVWLDGTPSNSQFIMWNQEPNDYFGQEDCGVIFSNGGYNDADCRMKAAFICELAAQASCPTRWISRAMTQGLDCYYFSNYKNSANLRTWSEAQTYCAAQAPSPTAVPLLLSVDDADEKAYVEQQLAGMRDNVQGWWTGLTDRDREGYWSFVGQATIPDPSLVYVLINLPFSNVISSNDLCIIKHCLRKYFPCMGKRNNPL
ncbi:hypothetical protein ACJMK2_006156 [Sinanodonta woodiana]|uniref:C-type lectin domain-containing protein n=1 Tax=Sinanodonta woodiana TaxID=1069815 RepID=A0ABD3VSI7_SINWO